jgi:transcription elongation GreA/GreB family factor
MEGAMNASSSHYYFLKDDYEALETRIRSITAAIIENGQEMGRSCSEGAETFHDNFAHEEGERQHRMWTRHLRELVRVRSQARVVDVEQPSDRVRLGSNVTVRDMQTGEERTLRMGSYMMFDRMEAVSYRSPLGRALIGAVAGEERNAVVAGVERSYLVIHIS